MNRAAVNVLVALFVSVVMAAEVIACAPDFPSQYGLESRSSEVIFRNIDGFARHEKWAVYGEELILHAGFHQETDEYGHNILGNIRDAKLLIIHTRRAGGVVTSCPRVVRLPDELVFEDIAPRLADMDDDGLPEIVVVESSHNMGARLAIYDRHGHKVTHTPYIGRPYRWLAPIGVADLDGDGFVEIAYIDRPHLAKTLRVWRYRDGSLDPVADMPGLTNHRIGEDFISGGIRDCGKGPEIITANSNWSRVMVTRLKSGVLDSRDIGPYAGSTSLTDALDCR